MGKILLAGALTVGGAAGIAGAAIGYDTLYDPKAPLPEKVFNTDPILCDSINTEKCTNFMPVPIEKMGGAIVDIVILKEDQNFYEHQGVDEIALARAIAKNTRDRSAEQGGSTIQNQTAGILFPEPSEKDLHASLGASIIASAIKDPISKEKHLEQFYDFRLGTALDETYSKKEILELYINNVYFGRGAYGIFEAARAYYGKIPQDLSVQEAIVLTAAIEMPSSIDLYVDGECLTADSRKCNDDEYKQWHQAQKNKEIQKLKERYDYVISILTDPKTGNLKINDPADPLTPISAEQLRNQVIQVLEPGSVPDAKEILGKDTEYFYDMVKREAETLTGLPFESLKGYRIVTTLDTNRQRHIIESAKSIIENTPLDGGIVEVDKNGAILALYGGRSYKESQVNLAAADQSGGNGMQFGSLAKLIVYGKAFENGLHPNDSLAIVDKAVITQDATTWEVFSNNECTRSGKSPDCSTITASEALGISSNPLAVNVFKQFIGDTNDLGSTMQMLGYGVKPPYYSSIILGGQVTTPLNLAIGTQNLLGNNGMVQAEAYTIRAIYNSEGKLIYEHKPVQAKQALSQDAVRMLIEATRKVFEIGTGKNTNTLPVHSIAGKTGTTATNGFDNAATGILSVLTSCDADNNTTTVAAAFNAPNSPNTPITQFNKSSRDVMQTIQNYTASIKQPSTCSL